MLEFVDLENFFILLNAEVSLDIEFPTPEKSRLLRVEWRSLGESMRWSGKFVWDTLFFF